MAHVPRGVGIDAHVSLSGQGDRHRFGSTQPGRDDGGWAPRRLRGQSRAELQQNCASVSAQSGPGSMGTNASPASDAAASSGMATNASAPASAGALAGSSPEENAEHAAPAAERGAIPTPARTSLIVDPSWRQSSGPRSPSNLELVAVAAQLLTCSSDSERRKS
jgi:hypothetical protein